MQEQEIASLGRWAVIRDKDGLRVLHAVDGRDFEGGTLEEIDLWDLKNCVETALKCLTGDTSSQGVAKPVERRWIAFTVKAEIPEAEIMALIREAGYEASEERVRAVCEDMQQNRFNEKHGGCSVSEVEEYVLGTAALVIEDFVESGEWDE